LTARTVRYVGRFAPSPTGQLHLGTLTAAVASYLHAKQAGGSWLLRIEDIDPPREVPGAADSFRRTLEALALFWDGEVRIQSQRLEVFRQAAETLHRDGLAFYCRCSRQQIRAASLRGAYPGTCRERRLPSQDAALRFRIGTGDVSFTDRLVGEVHRDIALADGDFVIFRRDGMPSYHLAVVIDDADQNVTDIVRGADLIESTPLHLCLQRALGLPTPRYWHIPLVLSAGGEKLSKGTGATPIDTANPGLVAQTALALLGAPPPDSLHGATPAELWAWAITHWRIDDLARRHRAPGPSDAVDE